MQLDRQKIAIEKGPEILTYHDLYVNSFCKRSYHKPLNKVIKIYVKTTNNKIGY